MPGPGSPLRRRSLRQPPFVALQGVRRVCRRGHVVRLLDLGEGEQAACLEPGQQPLGVVVVLRAPSRSFASISCAPGALEQHGLGGQRLRWLHDRRRVGRYPREHPAPVAASSETQARARAAGRRAGEVTSGGGILADFGETQVPVPVKARLRGCRRGRAVPSRLCVRTSASGRTSATGSRRSVVPSRCSATRRASTSSRSRRCARPSPQGPVGQPAYLNGAVELETELEPRALLGVLLDVERRLGACARSAGARTIDLDLLLHGDTVLDEPGLTLPHPHLHERRFALEPLAELAPTLSCRRRARRRPPSRGWPRRHVPGAESDRAEGYTHPMSHLDELDEFEADSSCS